MTSEIYQIAIKLDEMGIHHLILPGPFLGLPPSIIKRMHKTNVIKREHRRELIKNGYRQVWGKGKNYEKLERMINGDNHE